VLLTGIIVVIFMVAISAVMMVEGDLSWTWVFPFAATAATAYSSLRLRRVASANGGLIWSLVLLASFVGWLLLLQLPAHF
jgi:hypothetical protein